MNVKEELALRAELEGSAGTDTFQKNYLVEAGAGAGKSTTMVRRIANLLLNKVCEPEELVAITFTVKATQELREKLEELLRGKLAEEPDNAELQALVESAERIQVSTIDSFCRTLLATMPFSNPLGMSAEMRTNDEEMGRDFFRRRCRRETSDFDELCARYAINDRILENAFLQCCGLGDHTPSYRPGTDQLIGDIEQNRLPEAAKAMRTGVQKLLKDYPFLRGVIYPEFLAFMDRPDKDFAQGSECLEAFIPYMRSRGVELKTRELRGEARSAIIDEAAWAELAGRAIRLRDGLSAAVDAKNASTKKPGGKRARPKTPAEYMELRDDLRAIIAAAPQDAAFLNAEARKQIDSTADLTTDFKALADFQTLVDSKSKLRWTGKFNGRSLELMHELFDVIYPTLPYDSKAGGTPALEPDAFSALLSVLLHSAVLEKVAPLVPEYQEEKLAFGAATFNDVLVLARDMLRDNETARAYFRKRYRCYFVDEFQDTDALQTELLFYLTSEEKDFKPGCWQKCRPRPGSLFLVGDPKQAIYRFRGADIDTYTRVRERFEANDGIGAFKQLAFNFRSTREICGLTEQIFRPLLRRDPGGKNYQAEYADMLAVHNAGGQIAERVADPNSVVLAYRADDRDEEDCVRVANLIQSAMLRGAARAKDFLILTDVKERANAYARELLTREIPVNISGKESFSKTPVIAAAVIYLNYLLEQNDPVRLQLLLQSCYRVSPEAALRLRQRGGLGSITDVFRPAEGESRSWKKLDALTAALWAEQTRDEELLALCAALDEIRGYLQLSLSAPAISVLERLFSDAACLWPEVSSRLERRRDFARVRQFLNLLRGEQARDFPSLARRAVSLAEEAVEDELPLEPDGDCVRVMNVHKAKGLQGKIVILAYGNSLAKDMPALSCREPTPKQKPASGSQGASRKQKPLFHFCVTAGPKSVIGVENEWAGLSAEEERYLSAERTRLLYVAATRAERILLVNDCPSWEPVSEQIGDTDGGGSKLPHPERDAKWLLERAKTARDDGERALLAALAELYPEPCPEDEPKDDAESSSEDAPKSDAETTPEDGSKNDAETASEDASKNDAGAASEDDPKNDAESDPPSRPKSYTEKIIETLYPPEDEPDDDQDEPDTSDQDEPNVPAVTVVDPERLARERQALVDQYAAPTRVAITPSGLEHAYRPRADAIAAKGDGEEPPAENAADTAGDAGGAEDALAQFDPSDAPPPQSAPDPVSESPRGAHWGTVIHRVMELAVNRRAYDAESLQRFARQAAFETLSGKELSARERGMLCCDGKADEAAVIASVSEAAAKAAAFLGDEAAPLRQLLARGQSYTELPFVLRAEDPNDALYQHMSAHLKNRPERAMPLDVNGSIDLAVLQDGGWTVVDYKTDRQRDSEDEAAFRDRLASEYTPQIAAYAKVLEALRGESVSGAYLCSIPLGGALIELATDGADTPAASQSAAASAAADAAASAAAPASSVVSSPAPAQVGGAASYPLAELLVGRGFSPKLDGAAGATGFSLRQNGRAIPLIDKHGQTRETFKMCRDFSLGVSGWVAANCPGADASVDFTNAGSVVVLRRTLRMLKKALPAEVFESLEFSWEK